MPQMMPVQHQGYPQQQMPQNMHMMQQQYPQYPQQRMPGPGQHVMAPGQMQPHMMPPQGQQQQMQQVIFINLTFFKCVNCILAYATRTSCP